MHALKKILPLLALGLGSCGQPTDQESDLSAYALNFDASVNCGGMTPSTTPDTYRLCASFDTYAASGQLTPMPVAWDFVGFNELDREKLRKATLFMLQALEKHSYQKSKTGTSDLEACAAKYTTRNVLPKDPHPGVTSTDIKFHVNQMVMDYQVNITNHRFNLKTPVVFQAFYAPAIASSSDPDVLVYTVAKVDSVLGNNLPGQEFTRGIKAYINLFAISKFSEQQIGSAMFHEIMHLWGYQHPGDGSKNDPYPGTLIREVELCMTRGNLDKPTSVQKLPYIMTDDVGGSAMCQYKHKKDTKGGKKGQTTALDADGNGRSCDKKGDWKTACKDGNGDTDEVDCK